MFIIVVYGENIHAGEPNYFIAARKKATSIDSLKGLNLNFDEK